MRQASGQAHVRVQDGGVAAVAGVDQDVGVLGYHRQRGVLVAVHRRARRRRSARSNYKCMSIKKVALAHRTDNTHELCGGLV